MKIEVQDPGLLLRTLDRVRTKLCDGIEHTQRQRSKPDAVKALHISSMREDVRRIESLRDVLRAAIALRDATPPPSPGMTFDECMAPPECSKFPRCGCPHRYECIDASVKRR